MFFPALFIFFGLQIGFQVESLDTGVSYELNSHIPNLQLKQPGCEVWLCEATGKFHFHAKSFSSQCTEGIRGNCDFQFTFCFDKPTGYASISNCHYHKTVESNYWYGVLAITFGNEIKGISNPIVFNMDSFEDPRVRVLVRMTDADDGATDRLIGTMGKTITFTPASSLSAARYTSGAMYYSTHRLFYEYKAHCNLHYYGKDCTVRCQPRTERYSCASDGQKICATGRQGTNCDDDVDECKTTPDICSFSSSTPSSTSPHYACRNTIGSYKCVCAAGWKGTNCDQDVDECQDIASLSCPNNGNCSNTIGSYRCMCPSAWKGYNCTDQAEQLNKEDEETFVWWPIVVAVVVVVAVAAGIAGLVMKRRKKRNIRSISGRSLPSATDLNNSAGVISIVHKHGPPGLSSDPRGRGRLPVPSRNSSVSSKFTDSMVGSMYEGVEDRFQQGGVVLKGRRPSSEYLEPIPGKVGSQKSGFPRQDSATLAKDGAGSVNNGYLPSEAAKAERSGAEDYSLHRCLSVSVSNSSNVYYTANATDDSYSNFEPPAYSSLRYGGP